jgi:hypothetical protein
MEVVAFFVEIKKINDLLPKSARKWVKRFQKKHEKKTEEELIDWLNK